MLHSKNSVFNNSPSYLLFKKRVLEIWFTTILLKTYFLIVHIIGPVIKRFDLLLLRLCWRNVCAHDTKRCGH